MIKEQETVHLKHMANQARDAQASDFRAVGVQTIAPRPDTSELWARASSWIKTCWAAKRFLLRLLRAQTLLIFFDLDLHASVRVDHRRS